MTTKPNNALTAEQIEFFKREGYLILKDVFSPADLKPLQQEIEDAVDEQIRSLHAAGKLSDLHEREPFETRLARVQEDSLENAKAIINTITGKGGGGMHGCAMFDLIRNAKLLDLIESLVGPEIVGSSVYRMRPKLPGFAGGVVPWHQDSGYLQAFCDREMIITCWLPLVNATQANGCMRILPRAHRKICPHHTGGNAGFLIINDEELPGTMDDAVIAECPLGGAVLMTNLTPHCSTPNTTNITRWSVDLRYQGAEARSNVAVPPEGLLTEFENVVQACYPPEADFIIRSRKNPQSVADFETFVRRREAWESARSIPYPNRGWQPVASAAKGA